jgi:hypothetical protein
MVSIFQEFRKISGISEISRNIQKFPEFVRNFRNIREFPGVSAIFQEIVNFQQLL